MQVLANLGDDDPILLVDNVEGLRCDKQHDRNGCSDKPGKHLSDSLPLAAWLGRGRWARAGLRRRLLLLLLCRRLRWLSWNPLWLRAWL